MGRAHLISLAAFMIIPPVEVNAQSSERHKCETSCTIYNVPYVCNNQVYRGRDIGSLLGSQELAEALAACKVETQRYSELQEQKSANCLLRCRVDYPNR